jgi:hypothetical protein
MALHLWISHHLPHLMDMLVDLKEVEAVGNRDSRVIFTRADIRMACQSLLPVFHSNPWVLVPETSRVLEVQGLREGIIQTNRRGLAMDRH